MISVSTTKVAVFTTIAVAMIPFITGCESPAQGNFDPAWSPPAVARVRIGPIVDNAPKEKRKDVGNFDVSGELRAKLQEALNKGGIGGSSAGEADLVLLPKIVDYDPGNALGRWVAPGIGTTTLSVECRLMQGEREVGTVSTLRKVEGGGLYTIGQWRHIFDPVAADIADQLKKKLRP